MHLLVRRTERPDEVPALPGAGARVRREVVRPAMHTRPSSHQGVYRALKYTIGRWCAVCCAQVIPAAVKVSFWRLRQGRRAR